MELFIRIKDGKPFEHPILGDNFRAAFPHIDTANLPSEFARFKRIPPPPVGVYEVLDGVTYEMVNGMYTDVWHTRPMTEAEKLVLQSEVKNNWALHGYPSWQFDEATCSFIPPVPRPTDGQEYVWNEQSLTWVAQQP